MGWTEDNLVNKIGVVPFKNADPIPVEVAAWGADPLSVPPSTFLPGRSDYDWLCDERKLRNLTALTTQYYHAPVFFPDGVTVSRLTLYGYRTDADAIMQIFLFRADRAGVSVAMSNVLADWITGYSSGYNDTIVNPVIDNADCTYSLRVTLDPDANVLDVQFTGAKVTFT